MMERKIYGVSQVNRYVKAILAEDRILRSIWIRGELSNVKAYRDGTLYFTLKEEGAQISAVMFGSYGSRLRFVPVEGLRVNAFGEITLYERDGRYQIRVSEMEPDGEGALYQEYLRRKERLEKEGLFDPAKKKPIPPFARTVGLVTSQTGAVVEDMKRILRARYPGVTILLCPVAVQGESASSEIAEGIRRMNRDGRSEVLLVGRGGGSIEDLWAFNEEATVRAVYESRIPIISAVGHETDTTLTDFAADLRAATPTEAAERAVPDAFDLLQRLDAYADLYRSSVARKMEQFRLRLSYYQDRGAARMIHLQIEALRQKVLFEENGIKELTNRKVTDAKEQVNRYVRELALLDPYKPLEKGYSILEDDEGAVASINRLIVGQTVRARLRDGKAAMTVDEVITDD